MDRKSRYNRLEKKRQTIKRVVAVFAAALMIVFILQILAPPSDALSERAPLTWVHG